MFGYFWALYREGKRVIIIGGMGRDVSACEVSQEMCSLWVREVEPFGVRVRNLQ